MRRTISPCIATTILIFIGIIFITDAVSAQITFTPNVQIPGLSFTQTTKTENPLIAEYVYGIYRYGVSIVAIVATIMFIYGAFLYLIGSAISSIQSGKRIMIDAIIGMLLLLSASLILRVLNPDLLKLEPLAITPVKPEIYDFMEYGPGFTLGDELVQYQLHKDASQFSTGAAELLKPLLDAEIEGEGICADFKIEETGTKPYERLRAWCTKPEDRAQLDTFEEKIHALIRAVCGFYKICVLEKGCAYVRTGYTDLSSGSVGKGISDFPFMYKFHKLRTPDVTNPKLHICAAKYEQLQSAYGQSSYYTEFQKRDKSDDLNFSNFMPGGDCYKVADQNYIDNLLVPMSKAGILGGDCGSMLSQIYSCAGGTVGVPGLGGPGDLYYYINYLSYPGVGIGGKNRPRKGFVVWMAEDAEDFARQVEAAGGLKFGDIFVMGAFGKAQHNWMYTGGRTEFPFDIFEMGGGGSGDGTVGARVRITKPGGGSYTMGGMRTQMRGRVLPYILDYGKNCDQFTEPKAREYCVKRKGLAWPLSVARPYEVTTCETKEDCAYGEACLCTYSKEQGKIPEDCLLKNVCHRPASEKFMEKYSIQCNSDESCPLGWSCPEKAGQWGRRCKKD